MPDEFKYPSYHAPATPPPHPLYLRITQQLYMQVSAWMIRMEADLLTTDFKSKLTLDAVKKEIASRSAMFIQVCVLVLVGLL